MTDMLNMEIIYRQERQRWMKEEAPRKSVRDGIAQSVPYWIILVALLLFGVPHLLPIPVLQGARHFVSTHQSIGNGRFYPLCPVLVVFHEMT